MNIYENVSGAALALAEAVIANRGKQTTAKEAAQIYLEIKSALEAAARNTDR